MSSIARRTALTLLARLVLGAPLAAHAQPPGRPWRIGFLGDGRRSDRMAISLDPLREGLRELGYVEGETLVIEDRWSDGRRERLSEIAAELVRLNVDVIVSHGVPGSLAAQAATRTIPIVVAVAADLIGTGLVASHARPGGNVTGMTDQAAELNRKEIQLLREMVPRLKRLAILMNETNPGARASFEEARKAAVEARLEISVHTAREADRLEPAIERAAKARAEALLVIHDPLTVNQRDRIAQAALKHGLPSACASTPYVAAGGLMAYAPSLPGMFKRAAVFVDRILRGAKPAEIPVEQPTKFEFGINLKTARALGIVVPESLLLRAEQVVR